MITDREKQGLLLVHTEPSAPTVRFSLYFTAYLNTWYNEAYEEHLCMFCLLSYYITMALSMTFCLEK